MQDDDVLGNGNRYRKQRWIGDIFGHIVSSMNWWFGGRKSVKEKIKNDWCFCFKKLTSWQTFCFMWRKPERKI